MFSLSLRYNPSNVWELITKEAATSPWIFKSSTTPLWDPEIFHIYTFYI